MRLHPDRHVGTPLIILFPLPSLQAITDGAKCLVLTGRAPRLTKEQLIALATKSDAAVFVVAADAGSRPAMRRLIGWVHESLPAVQQYVHAAGTLGYDALADVTPQAFWDVCR